MERALAGLIEGKVALVAGGGRGIGRAISERLAGAGALVAVGDISLERAEETAAAIRALGGSAFAVSGDVRSASDVEAMVGAAQARGERIDILVNNAGGAYLYAERRPLAEWTDEDWDDIVSRNLRYVFLTCRAVLRRMVAQATGGSIVNVASIDGVVSSPNVAAYGAAKAGVISLTRTLAAEYGEHGIRVNAFAPGYVKTPAAARSDTPEMRARIPLGRPGTLEEAGNVALFFASDLSSYVTGQTLMLDGGVTVRYPFPQPPPKGETAR